VEHRKCTVGRVVVAGNVASERTNTVGRVAAAGCVAKERVNPVGRVVAAGCVAEERTKTDCRVIGANCELEERISTLSRVVVGIASVRWWINRARSRGKRKRCEHQRDEKQTVSQKRSVGRCS